MYFSSALNSDVTTFSIYHIILYYIILYYIIFSTCSTYFSIGCIKMRVPRRLFVFPARKHKIYSSNRACF